MGDQERRELSRREGGDLDARVQAFVQRVRHGELSQADMELAAYCGHPVAAVHASQSPPRHLTTWVRGLGRFGDQVCAVAASALARLADEARASRPSDELLQAAGGVGAEEAHEELMGISRALVESSGTHLASAAGRLRDELAYLPYEDFSAGLRARLASLIGWRSLEDQKLRHLRREASRRREVSPERLEEADRALREALSQALIAHVLDGDGSI